MKDAEKANKAAKKELESEKKEAKKVENAVKKIEDKTFVKELDKKAEVQQKQQDTSSAKADAKKESVQKAAAKKAEESQKKADEKTAEFKQVAKKASDDVKKEDHKNKPSNATLLQLNRGKPKVTTPTAFADIAKVQKDLANEYLHSTSFGGSGNTRDDEPAEVKENEE